MQKRDSMDIAPRIVKQMNKKKQHEMETGFTQWLPETSDIYKFGFDYGCW